MRNQFAATCRRIMLAALACAGMIMIAGAETATAQLCQPCSSGASYRIIIGPTWDIRLGYSTLAVDVTDMGTGVTQTQYHTQLTAGTYTGTFPTTHPGHTYGISNVTLTTALGTIYWVYCDPSGPVCYPIGNPAVWLKFTFSSGPSPHCYTIQIEKTTGPC